MFERLPAQPRGTELADIETPLGSIRLCPVEAPWTRAMPTWHSAQASHSRPGASGFCTTPGRCRALYTRHSPRVAAVCYLLQPGLPKSVISVLANWSAHQVRR